jgi:hypothetical protein
MTRKTLPYDGYELYPYELPAVVGYMERRDASELERIIREPPESPYSVMSKGMRDFIADVIAGKKTRTRKKASSERRDFEMALAIDDLMFFKGYSLRSASGGKDGAAAIVAERFGIKGKDPEETAVKAYQRFKHIAETPKPEVKKTKK